MYIYCVCVCLRKMYCKIGRQVYMKQIGFDFCFSDRHFKSAERCFCNLAGVQFSVIINECSFFFADGLLSLITFIITLIICTPISIIGKN